MLLRPYEIVLGMFAVIVGLVLGILITFNYINIV